MHLKTHVRSIVRLFLFFYVHLWNKINNILGWINLNDLEEILIDNTENTHVSLKLFM